MVSLSLFIRQQCSLQGWEVLFLTACRQTAVVLLGPVVQSVVRLTSSLRVISLTVLADSIYNILIFFAEKMWVAFALQKLFTFSSAKKIQHICVSLDENFNETLTNDIVSLEQLGPGSYGDPKTSQYSCLSGVLRYHTELWPFEKKYGWNLVSKLPQKLLKLEPWNLVNRLVLMSRWSD